MTFREMLIEDLDQVMEIETDLFAIPVSYTHLTLPTTPYV